MKNHIHLSTGHPLLDGLISSVDRFKFLVWLDGLESPWMQNGVEKDAVDLEAGKVHPMMSSVKAHWYHSNWNFPTHNASISICVLIYFVLAKIVQLQFWRKKECREKKTIMKLRRLSLLCGPSISQIRKLKFFIGEWRI